MKHQRYLVVWMAGVNTYGNLCITLSCEIEPFGYYELLTEKSLDGIRDEIKKVNPSIKGNVVILNLIPIGRS